MRGANNSTSIVGEINFLFPSSILIQLHGPVLSVAFLRVLCVKSKRQPKSDSRYTIASTSATCREPNFLTATARLAMVPPMLPILNCPFSSAAVLVFHVQIIGRTSMPPVRMANEIPHHKCNPPISFGVGALVLALPDCLKCRYDSW